MINCTVQIRVVMHRDEHLLFQKKGNVPSGNGLALLPVRGAIRRIRFHPIDPRLAVRVTLDELAPNQVA